MRDAGSFAARVSLPLCRSGSVRQKILHIELFSSIQQPDVAVVDRDLLRSAAGIFYGTLANHDLANPGIEHAPFGLHAVTAATQDMPAGVIFVLKNRSGTVNIDHQNRLHPFYMVYISKAGEIICDHLSPKQMLDKMRYLCKAKTQPIPELYRDFNKETHDGKNMEGFSRLLGDAISSIIEVKAESDINSFLGGEQISFLANKIKGLDDFELVCFLVVRDAPKKAAAKMRYAL